MDAERYKSKVPQFWQNILINCNMFFQLEGVPTAWIYEGSKCGKENLWRAQELNGNFRN